MSDVHNPAQVKIPKFWKLSHGKTDLLPNDANDWFIQNNYVAIGYTPDDKKGKHQGQRFAGTHNGVSEGDYFYLVRNQKIILLGRFDTSSVEPASKPDGWWMRSFEVIRNIIDRPYPSSKVKGSDGWKPQGHTTLTQIPSGLITEFSSTILEPAFQKRYQDLDYGPVKKDTMNIDSNTGWNNSGALNRILYGPPGTGKTFHTVTHALQIIDQKIPSDQDEQRKRFTQLRNEGRIAFVTFHQSFSYEDFIEGIRADVKDTQLNYVVKDGIFKQMATAAMFSKIQRKQSTGASSADIDFGDLFNAFKEWTEENPNLEIESITKKKLRFLPTASEDTLYVRHGDSAKPHPAGRDRLSKLYKKYPTADSMTALTSKGIINTIGGANTTAYWAVLNALLKFKQEHLAELQAAKDELSPEISLDYNEKKARINEAEPADFGPGEPFVLIIDEINRGNTSRVFGELITLIEDTKRAGRDEKAELTLPYSNELFTVPDNLYIIGTMNTADRSLAAIDTALRRRFDFIEMMPSADELKDKTVAGVDLSRMLTAINNRIEQLYDREHTIGHAFFMRLTSGAKINELAHIFNNKILPLLEEYFFEDWEKIARVLGKAAIYKPKPTADLGFATTNTIYYRDTDVLLDPKTYIHIYELNSPANDVSGVPANG